MLAALLSTFIIWEGLTALFFRASGISLGDLKHGPLKLTWPITLAQLSTYLPVLATLFGMLPWLATRSLRDLGLRPLTRRDLSFAAGGAVAMYAATICTAAIQYAFTHQEPKEQAVALFTSTKDPALVIAFGIVATLAAPFAEELVFRGFLFNALLRYLPVAVAAVLSGLLFGAAHMLGSSWTVLPPLAASGIVLAYVYYLSGSLTASMLTHAAFNIVNVLLIAADGVDPARRRRHQPGRRRTRHGAARTRILRGIEPHVELTLLDYVRCAQRRRGRFDAVWYPWNGIRFPARHRRCSRSTTTSPSASRPAASPGGASKDRSGAGCAMPTGS